MAEDVIDRIGEDAHVFGLVPSIRQRSAFLAEERGRNARTVQRGDLDALPVRSFVLPCVIEESPFTKWRRHGYESSARNGKHRPYCVVQVVRHTACLVKDNQVNTAIPSDVPLPTRPRKNAASIGEFKLELVLSVSRNRSTKGMIDVDDLAKCLLALAFCGA